MVFETLVADVLNRFIGQYVENLDSSQLNIGIWGGKLKFEHILFQLIMLKKFSCWSIKKKVLPIYL